MTIRPTGTQPLSRPLRAELSERGLTAAEVDTLQQLLNRLGGNVNATAHALVEAVRLTALRNDLPPIDDAETQNLARAVGGASMGAHALDRVDEAVRRFTFTFDRALVVARADRSAGEARPEILRRLAPNITDLTPERARALATDPSIPDSWSKDALIVDLLRRSGGLGVGERPPVESAMIDRMRSVGGHFAARSDAYRAYAERFSMTHAEVAKVAAREGGEFAVSTWAIFLPAIRDLSPAAVDAIVGGLPAGAARDNLREDLLARLGAR